MAGALRWSIMARLPGVEDRSLRGTARGYVPVDDLAHALAGHELQRVQSARPVSETAALEHKRALDGVLRAARLAQARLVQVLARPAPAAVQHRLVRLRTSDSVMTRGRLAHRAGELLRP